MRSAAIVVGVLTSLWAAAAGAQEVEFKPYGFILLNAVYNTDGVNSLEAPTVATGGGDNAFTITPRQTRVGFNVSSALSEATAAQGTIEVDFWGLHGETGPGAITQTSIRLRLAYVKLTHDNLELLLGQNWSILNNPFPTSMVHVVIPAFTAGGNLWNRLPQITGSYKHPSGIKVWLSLVRPHSADGTGAITQVDTPDPGALGQAPFVQARVAYESDMLTVGAAGHFGSEKHELMGGGTDSAPTWAAAADAKLTTGPLGVYVEAFVGANLNCLFSAAGVVETGPQDISAVKTMGGWLQLTYQISPELSAVAAAGTEQVDDDDATNIDANSMIMVNLTYAPFAAFALGVEYSRNMTTFVGDVNESNNQFGLAARYKF